MHPTSQTLATGPFKGSLVAEQNDRFRTSLGTDPGVPGRIVITAGVNALSEEAKAQIITAVRSFSEFTADNDPFGLHDFGAFEVQDEGRTVRLYWKFDLYDLAYHFGSEAPDDPSQTRRVLTILLPDEW
jgi:hypothetical protein